MCARKARGSAAEQHDESEASAQSGEASQTTAPAGGEESGEAGQSDEGGDENQISVPERINGEVLSCVASAATTISGCSEAEIKNYAATADYACRQVAVQLADLWKRICLTAAANSKSGEKPAKVSLSASIVIDQTNMLIMSTKVKTGFGVKHQAQDETQEDLRQVQFKLAS